MTEHTCPTFAYELNQRILALEDGEMRTGYGITCIQHLPCGTRHTVDSLFDISPCKDILHAMAELFTRCELSPDRFRQTVIDLLP